MSGNLQSEPHARTRGMVPKSVNRLARNAPKQASEKFQLVDLPNDLLSEVYGRVNAKVAFRTTCRKLRDAVPAPRGFKPHSKLVGAVQSLSLVEWAWNTLQGWPVLTGALVAAAAMAGPVEVMRFLASKPSVVFTNDQSHRDPCKVAAMAGRLEMLKYLHGTLGLRVGRFVAYAAARKGQIKVYQYLDSQGLSADYEQALLAAAGSGQLAFLQWMFRKRKIVKPPLRRAAVIAAKRGHANVVYWVCSVVSSENWSRTMGVPRICKEAAESGLLDLLKHLIAYGLGWPPKANDLMLECAVEGGNLDVVKFVLAHGDEWTPLHTKRAASNGHLDILKYAHAQGLGVHANDVREAAVRCCQLETLKWSTALDRHLDKTYWLSQMCKNATNEVFSGRDEMLAWLSGQAQ